MKEDEDERESPQEFREARRQLQAAIHETVERVAARLPLRSGEGETLLTWHQEPGRSPIASLWLYHHNCREDAAGAALRPDAHRGFRFFLDELPVLARGFVLLLEWAEQYAVHQRAYRRAQRAAERVGDPEPPVTAAEA